MKIWFYQMIEMSAFLIFYSGNRTFINSFDKTKFYECFILTPTLQHSFFRNYTFVIKTDSCLLLLITISRFGKIQQFGIWPMFLFP